MNPPNVPGIYNRSADLHTSFDAAEDPLEKRALTEFEDQFGKVVHPKEIAPGRNWNTLKGYLSSNQQGGVLEVYHCSQIAPQFTIHKSAKWCALVMIVSSPPPPPPPPLHLAAGLPFLVNRVLQKYEVEFFEVVTANHRLLTLIREGVIDQDVQRAIESSNDKDAKEILYGHLINHSSVDTLRTYCKVIIGAVGYPRMQQLGQKMKVLLEQGQ